ncbi:MAG: hypothetical protein ACT4P5_08640 [Armatimonadota bacterium]
MHEGDHAILDHDHDHDHNHKLHAHQEDRRGRTNRVVAALVVGAAVVLFLAWRFF